MKMYKGFDKDLKCRGYQYQIGRTEKEESAELCERGFHACEYPLDVFNYYPPADSRFCEVDLNGVTDETGDDSKRCGTEIKVLAEIGIPGIVKASVDFIMRNIKSDQSAAVNSGVQSAAVNSGDQSAAVNSGFRSAAVNSGVQSAAVNSGFRSAAVNSGFRSAAVNSGVQSAAVNSGVQSAAVNSGVQSAAVNSGVQSAATVEGKESVAISLGIKGKAKGAVGCWLVLSLWKQNDEFDWHRVAVKSFYVDGETIKADTFYMLNEKEEPVEVE